jgi:D-3-phosphoglycerate dehydrogenase / 2-oxoglutarate reductase
MPRTEGAFRLSVVNSNVPNMLGQISSSLAKADLNIIDMLNKSRGDLAYTLVDVDKSVPQSVLDEVTAIEGVLAVRAIDE